MQAPRGMIKSFLTYVNLCIIEHVSVHRDRRAPAILQFFYRNCNFLLQIIKGFKNEVDNLMFKVVVLEEKKENQPPANSNGRIITQGQELNAQELLFEEFEDQRGHAKNVITFNVPESSRDINDRKTDDLDSVVDLMASSRLGCYRDGEGSHNMISPIFVVLPSEDINVSLLSKFEIRYSLYINNDLTKRQQDSAYRVRQEFKGKLGDGEEGITLKHYKGIPTIVRLKNQLFPNRPTLLQFIKMLEA